MAVPQLPSPLFVLLTPEKAQALPEDRLPPIFQAIESGAWQMDPNEVHPETGLTLFQAVARSPALFDEVRNELLSFMAKKGANLEASPADGLTARAWAMKHGHLDLAQVLEHLGAKVPPGFLNARQTEVLRELGRVKDSWAVLAMLPQAMDPEVFGTLDAKVRGMPLGLHIAAPRLQINYTDLVGEKAANDPKARQNFISHLMKSLGTLGRRALELEPGSRFSVWCWLAQCQQMFSDEMDVSATRSKQWNAAWRRLEKSILSHLAKGAPALQAQDVLAQTVVGMGREVIGDLGQRWTQASPNQMARPRVSAPDQALRDLQRAAAYLMASLRSWAERIDPDVEDWDQVHALREKAVFEMADTLVRATPESAWQDPDFSDCWRSAAYYSLNGGLYRALGDGAPMPECMTSPWTILPLLLPAYVSRPDQLQVLEKWLIETPASPEDHQRALWLVTGEGEAEARLRALLLETRLEEAPSGLSESSQSHPPRLRF